MTNSAINLINSLFGIRNGDDTVVIPDDVVMALV